LRLVSRTGSDATYETAAADLSVIRGVDHQALLDGLWTLLSMLEIMDAYTSEQLDGLRKTVRQFV